MDHSVCCQTIDVNEKNVFTNTTEKVPGFRVLSCQQNTVSKAITRTKYTQQYAVGVQGGHLP